MRPETARLRPQSRVWAALQRRGAAYAVALVLVGARHRLTRAHGTATWRPRALSFSRAAGADRRHHRRMGPGSLCDARRASFSISTPPANTRRCSIRSRRPSRPTSRAPSRSSALGIGIAWFGERLRTSAIARDVQHRGRAGARGASQVDSRHRARRDDRHRRARHHPVVQRGGRAAVRLQRRRRCSARTSRC